MANRLILKKSSVAAKVPLATDLEIGELAVNLADAKLYSKNASGVVIAVGGSGSAVDWSKQNVRAATTANITLSGTQTIDGIALVAGDRVLVKDQTTTSQNGIYVVSATAWARPTDADTSAEIAAGVVGVSSGTTNGGLHFDTDFKSTDTIGTTAMIWARVVDTSYTIPVTQGGTGAITAAAALTNLGAAALASPTFTGTPAAPTAAVGTNTTQLATTAYVNAEIANDAFIKAAGGAIVENSQTISANYTLTAGTNGMSAGDITINSGITVTIPSGAKWVIV